MNNDTVINSSTNGNKSEQLELEPDAIVRPQVSESAVISLISRLYGLTVTSIKEQNSYDDRNFMIKVADKWENPHIKHLCSHGYVVKILNSLYSQRTHVDAEHDMQQIMVKNGLRCPNAVLNVHGQFKSLEKFDNSENNNAVDGQSAEAPFSLNLVRLMEFIPGEILHSVPYTPSLIHDVGEFTAKMHTVWQDYHHEALENYNHIWSLAELPSLRPYVYAVRDPSYRVVVEEVITDFQKSVIPNSAHFRKGVVHGDVNEQNIIVQPIPGQENIPEGTHKEHYVHGILDFGDALETYYVYEVGIAITYLCIESKVIDPLLVTGHALAGYTKHRSLNDYEFNALKTCIAGRLCQSLVMGEYTYSRNPQNDYVLTTGKSGWPVLERFWKTPQEELHAMWKDVMKLYN